MRIGKIFIGNEGLDRCVIELQDAVQLLFDGKRWTFKTALIPGKKKSGKQKLKN